MMVAGDRAGGHGDQEALVLAEDGELLSRLKRAKATSMVGRETRRDSLPAILMSVP